MDERIKTLAKNLVHYSCKVKKGDNVYIHYIGAATEQLAMQITKEVYLAGGNPFPHFTNQRVQREMLLSCNEEQLKLMAELDAKEMSQITAVAPCSVDHVHLQHHVVIHEVGQMLRVGDDAAYLRRREEYVFRFLLGEEIVDGPLVD